MKVMLQLLRQELKDIPELAQRAEALGYDGILFGELTLDPFLAAALGAQATRRIALATGAAIAFPRSPMVTANLAWHLQALSGGRFQLGLATQVKGHSERRFSVPWAPPAQRLREYILALRAIWDTWQNGSRLNFQGKHYTFTLMTPEFNPGPIAHPRIPIYIGAVNPYMARLAGEVADGILLLSFTSRRYIQEVTLPNLEVGLQRSGRSLKDIEIIAGGNLTYLAADGEDMAEQVREARRFVSFYASTRTYKAVMDVHGWGDVCLQLHELSAKGRWAEMPGLITDEMLHTFAVVGTCGDMAERLKARFGPWATRVTVPLPSRSQEGRFLGVVQALQAG
ncbi:MAG: TIGR03617 family F420-dependent LLM class oxidoreductase [Chloroflexi bacterium]|nr:TIGR03617 family F420-dependent LLM class oxidoreductase [Chloroflexota bacterium]